MLLTEAGTSAEKVPAWRRTLLTIDRTIGDAVINLDRTSAQIVLVVKDGLLHGSVTDGDIRRALLRGMDFNSPVTSVMNPSPMVVTPEVGRELVLDLMRANKIHQLPVVDVARRVVGLYIWDDIVTPPKRSNSIVIMAGGFGKRLRPYTDECPKPMLPLAGKPMLEHIIARAAAEGFKDFIVSVHYLGHVIKDYFGDGTKFNVRISYIDEDTPLGTAGAISLIDPTPTEGLVVTNGDLLTDIRYGELLDFHKLHGATATMAVRLHEWQHPFGVVKTEGIKIVAFEEKPVHRSYVNAGIYVLEPTALRMLPRGEACDMPALFDQLRLGSYSTVAYPMHEPWLDVGRPDDLNTAKSMFERGLHDPK